MKTLSCLPILLSLILIIIRIVLIVLNSKRDRYSGLFSSFVFITLLSLFLFECYFEFEHIKMPLNFFEITIFIVIPYLIFIYMIWDVYQEYAYYKLSKLINKLQKSLPKSFRF